MTTELALGDIESAQYRRRWWQAPFGLVDLHVRARRPIDDMVFRGIRRSEYVLWLIEMLRHGEAVDEGARISAGDDPDADDVRDRDRLGSTGLLWRRTGWRLALGPALVACAVATIVLVLHGSELTVRYPTDDAIYPNGRKRSRDEIVRYMRSEVMPFAQRALAPVAARGGRDRITCYTCHGRDAEARDWRMPGVRALPEPDLREAGLERFARAIDPELRNAIYGYLARGDKQHTAGYMRDVVMPGMAALSRPVRKR